MMKNLFATFAWDLPAPGERLLLKTPAGNSYTYADAERESARVANLLTELGLQPGDRVTVQAPKSAQEVWLYLGCLRAGLIYHPLNEAYQSKELEFFISDAAPSAIICDPGRQTQFAELIDERSCHLLTMDIDGAGSLADAAKAQPTAFATVNCGFDAIAVLLYSSGTTGTPKGALLSHGNLAANTATLVDYWGFSEQDRLLHALPIYHAHGLFVGLGCALTSGASLLFLPRFDARDVMRHLPEATAMMGIPTFYTRLLAEPDFNAKTCASMRLFISGSAPLLASTHKEFSARTGHAILERYGMTETSMLSSNPLKGERRAGTVGMPLPGVDIRIVDGNDQALETGAIGDIQVRGPNVFKGYWQLPEKTAQEFTADGFFRTGDQGRFSDDGYLTIIGRYKDMVITGGLNVYPVEVEQALNRLAQVQESAVIGVPHADFGEGVIAIVVPAPGQEPAEADIIAALRDELAGFKTPKRVFLRPELPRNAMGKVQKNELRQEFTKVFS